MGMSTDEPNGEFDSERRDDLIGRHSRGAQDVLHSSRLGSSFRKRRMRPTARGLLAVVLIGLVVAGLFVDAEYPFERKQLAKGHVIGAAPADASSSAWYCPMMYATAANPNASSMVVLNPNDRTLSGIVTYFPQGKASVDVPLNVPARTRLSLHAGDVVDAPYAAALVRFDGGGAAVEQSVTSAGGPAFAPCATQASAEWYFADGSTQTNTSLQIGLFNPFLEDAIADVSFITSDGSVAPDEFQGVLVPARSFTSINVGERVRRREWISTTVTARSGRIVSSELQTGTINGVPGTGLTLGAAGPRDVWYLPDGVNVPGFTDQITLFNPNDVESEANVEIIADKGSIAPFQLHVPAKGRVTVNIDKEERVPKDASYGTVVKVTNGVGVVVQRSASATTPASTTGAFFQIADTDLSDRWIVPLNETRDPFDDWVYVMNPGGKSAQVKVTGVSPVGQPLTSTGSVEPGRRLLIHVDEFAKDNSNPGLIIESTEPIVTGRTLYVNPGIGLTSSLVIPVR
jgi:hypothetical protein